ncbi:MAG: amidohydrolase family protein [Candidatus Bathyarchaeia archaeon]
MFDILIRKGKVVSGAGNPWFRSDVAVKDGKIAEVGPLGAAEAERTIDAEGLVVCPGFVDMHNHSDSSIMINPKAESYIRQGVTTLVFPNCGSGVAPLNEALKEEFRQRNPAFFESGLDLDWSTFEEYLQRMEEIGTAVNVAPLIGFGTIRRYVVGWEMRAPTRGELEEMRAEVEKAMKAGAFGLTTGLRYVPQSWAETEEVIELAKVAAEYGGFYASHLRDEGDRGDPIGAIKEIIEIGEKAGLPVNISHFKILARPHWGECDEILQLIEEARARGVDVTADQYPYPASGSSPRAWLPRWAREGGDEGLLTKLKDPETRAKIREEVHRVMTVRGGPEAALIRNYPLNHDYIGKTVAEVTRMLGRDDPTDTLLDIYQEHVEKLVAGEVEGRFSFMNFNMLEENVDKMMRKPWVMVSSDGSVHAPYGPLVKRNPAVHPRYYGSYPRVLGRYVRERKVLSLEEAIRKMTSLETQRLGILDRGLIAEGMWADITVFDPETVIDRAEFTPPAASRRYPEGIPYVIVNGVLTIDEGEHTGALAGKVLRKRS